MKKSIVIGTSGWSYPDWGDNSFYPADLAKNRWLEYYSSHFGTVELNATFYRNFPPQVYQNWYQKTPTNFHFVVKVSRYVTHRKLLIDVSDAIKGFEENVLQLREKLGLVLLQLPPKMPYHPDRLHDALSAFSDPSRVVVEFRNEKWLTDEVKSILTKFNSIFCNIDSPELQIYDCLTADIAYLRLHGHKKMYDYNYSTRQLKKMVEVIHKLNQDGAKTIYVFFNNDYYAHAPHNAQLLKDLLNLK